MALDPVGSHTPAEITSTPSQLGLTHPKSPPYSGVCGEAVPVLGRLRCRDRFITLFLHIPFTVFMATSCFYDDIDVGMTVKKGCEARKIFSSRGCHLGLSVMQSAH